MEDGIDFFIAFRAPNIGLNVDFPMQIEIKAAESVLTGNQELPVNTADWVTRGLGKYGRTRQHPRPTAANMMTGNTESMWLSS